MNSGRVNRSMEEGSMSHYSRKPAEMRFPKQWEHMTFRQTRENLLDKGSIYGPVSKKSLPRPGHRDALTKEAADIGCKKERHFLRKVTGYPMSARISGSARAARRSLPTLRRPTANTICQEYQYVHNGLRGKMILNNKRFRHDLPEYHCDHSDEEKSHYCEVLGKRTCAGCIEETNKKMAAKYQNDAFPSIQTTAASLVAPRLSKALTKRNTNQSRELVSRQLSISNLDDADSPIPYRMSSALRQSRRVTIYNDTMIESLHRTLVRDRRMTLANLKDVSLNRKPSKLRYKAAPKNGSLLKFLFNGAGLTGDNVTTEQ
ncbi:uncharacterized protein [Apostichopus japonicus]